MGANYISQARGFLFPPLTGEYVFSIAGADNCQLWLSTDESRFRRNLIAEVAVATAWRDKDRNTRQRSAPIRLEAGKRYYVEILHKKGEGRDYLAVGWDIPSTGQTIITRDFLQPCGADPADSNDDGLPDEWERATGLASLGFAPESGSFGDPDGDLLPNYLEWREGTDPLKADAGRRPGFLLQESWDSITGASVDRLLGSRRYPALPDHRALVRSSEMIPDRGSWQGSRLRGYLIPPVSGSYRVMVSGDDEARLLVGTGESKFTRVPVASAPFWTRERDFGRDPRQSAEVRFEAGKSYYFELLLKEETGGDHAAVAWILPGSKEPEIPAGAAIAAFGTDPDDLDDDELPDTWERSFDLDARDNGNVDFAQGPWGDPDSDGVVNLEEWRLGTHPRNRDTDGDGLEDGTELYLTGTSPVKKDDLTLVRVATLSPGDAKTIRGRTEAVKDGLRSLSQSGALAFEFELDEDGVAFLELDAHIIPKPSGVPVFLALTVDGVSIGSYEIRQFSADSGRLSARLPRLRKGAHTLEIGWSLPDRTRAVMFESALISLLPGDLPADSGANVVLSTAADSLTSPFCLEGRATFFSLVTTSPAAPLKQLPNKGWCGEVALPEDGSPLEITTEFENGLARDSRKISWRACDILSSGDLLIRAGDSLRLTAVTADPAELTISVDGKTTAVIAPSVAVPHLFPGPGVYRVAVTGSNPENPIAKTITVTALQAEVPRQIRLVPAQERRLSLPGLPAAAGADPDDLLHFTEVSDKEPREFVVFQQNPGRALVAFRMPDHGPVLQTTEVTTLSLLSDLDTWYGTNYDQYGNKSVFMDVFAPGIGGSIRLKIEILAPGVVFEDGSTVLWLTPKDFNRDDIATVRFLMLSGLQTSFCHRITIYDGDTVIGVRE